MLRTALPLLALALVAPVLGVLGPVGTALPGAAAAVKQSGRTSLLPPLVQPGSEVALSKRARLVGTVTFRPVRQGRPVVIQRRVGTGSWKNVTVRRQNARGTVRFVGPAQNANGRWFAYRGVARRWNALSRVTATPQRANVWQTKFRDEFNGRRLNLAKWSYRQLGDFSADRDRACSASRKRAVQVGNGRVRLQVKLDRKRQRRLGPCVARDKDGDRYSNRHWYMNGHISTERNPAGRFRYGIAAARVKFDRPVGAHGSFWMQTTVPYQAGRGPARNGAEIDVVEYFGKKFKKGDIYSFVHYRDASGTAHKVPPGPTRKARRALRKDDDWFKKFHVFSVQWTPKAYVFRVDGIPTRRITRGVSKVPEFLILSMLSSGWELERMNRRTLPNATQVDWVRYWKR